MTDADIKKLREECDAIPDGWFATEGCCVFADGYALIADTLAATGDGATIEAPWSREQCHRIAKFIAASRQTIPALLDEIERLRTRPWERLRELGFVVDERPDPGLRLTSEDVEALRFARNAVLDAKIGFHDTDHARAAKQDDFAAALAVIDRLIKGGE